MGGGVGKSLKVNKWGVAISRGGGGKSSKVNVYGVGCYKWMWREDQHMHWIKNFNFLTKNLLHLLHISSMLKICLSLSFIMSSSLAQLSAAFSVLLAEI